MRDNFAGKFIDLAIREQPAYYSFPVPNPCSGCYSVRIKIDEELTVLGGGQRVREFTVMAYGNDDKPVMDTGSTARGFFALDDKGEFTHVEYGGREYAISRE